MTYYNYVSEMQALCFRATQALTVLGKDGTKDFYSAAEVGFSKQMDELNNKPVSEISTHVSQDQLDTLLSTKKFVEDQENQAAWTLRRQQEAAENKPADVRDDCFDMWLDMGKNMEASHE